MMCGWVQATQEVYKHMHCMYYRYMYEQNQCYYFITTVCGGWGGGGDHDCACVTLSHPLAHKQVLLCPLSSSRECPGKCLHERNNKSWRSVTITTNGRFINKIRDTIEPVFIIQIETDMSPT